MAEVMPARGAVFWPVGTGDSTTLVVDDSIVMQVDIHDLFKADNEDTAEVPVVDRLVEVLPQVGGRPYLAVFVLTHADQDHCRGFADLLKQVTIGQLWATPRLWREFEDPDAIICDDARAFQKEAERRVAAVKKAVAAGKTPASGDRVLVIGYDTDKDKHSYSELPDEYLTGPGKAITELDGVDCAGRFEAFLHAPFKDDCAAPRNETSVAMQVTLTGDGEAEPGKLLLFGDLAHDTIMKIFTYSEYHKRPERLEWDVLLAPHHCSKKVMYTVVDGKDARQDDVLDAFERHARPGAVIVSSSGPVPASNKPGENPPHAKAKARYLELVDTFVCTMERPSVQHPAPVVFEADKDGLSLLGPAEVEAAVALSVKEAAVGHRRLALVARAAAAVGRDVGTRVTAVPVEDASGPAQVRQAIADARGSAAAPAAVTGFGGE